MNEIIRKRKSIRKYDMTPLDSPTLEKARARLSDVRPLYAGIRFSIDTASKTKGIFGVKAPHYFIFRSEMKDGAFENIGFVGQQMDLFFSKSGLGSCWLGMAKPENEPGGALPFVISMAFGRPAEPLYRDLSGFKRKPLSEISEGSDERLEAARLAPSAMNAQNWYFIADSGAIHCYLKKGNPLLGFMSDRLGRIDMGIAICHIMEERGGKVRFSKEQGAPARKELVYVGTV